MSEFYNPYHFVPLNSNAKLKGRTYEEISKGKTDITHQLWKKNLLSGSVFVAMTNISPLIVGGKRVKDNDGTTYVDFYRQKVAGHSSLSMEASIPGNTLRGMISSTIETISDSSLRILEDRAYSQRKPMTKALSAIGILRKVRDAWNVEPLTLPNTKNSKGKQEIFSHYTESPDEYDEDGEKVEIPKPQYTYYPADLSWDLYLKWNVDVYTSYRKGGEEKLKIKSYNPLSNAGIELKCFQASTPEYIYVLHEHELSIEMEDDFDQDNYNFNYYDISISDHSSLLLGQKLNYNSKLDTLITEEKHSSLSPDEQKKYIRSILFCYGGKAENVEKLSAKKENEYLIPYPVEKEDKKKFIPLHKNVLRRFNSLIATASNLVPRHGWENNVFEDEHNFSDGDLVYFDCDENGITELSYSSIWRSEISGESTFNLLRKSGHETYLPFGNRTTETSTAQQLDIAESLLGVVEDLPERKNNNTTSGKALSSRISINDAVSIRKISVETYRELPVLDSPKPPSPAMYLHNGATGLAPTKSEAADTNIISVLNGRKNYIAQKNISEIPEGNSNAGTSDMKTKAEYVSPSKEPSFVFSIDFENLTNAELDLLLTALGSKQYRENQAFQQRIGAGKPYGCGQITLDLLDVMFTDKKQRYQTMTPTPIYSTRINNHERNPATNELILTYATKTGRERLSAYLNTSRIIEESRFNKLDTERLIGNGTSLEALMYLNNPDSFDLNTDVKYPKAHGSDDIFKWFSNNNEKENKPKTREQYQGLGKLKPLNKGIASLKEN